MELCEFVCVYLWGFFGRRGECMILWCCFWTSIPHMHPNLTLSYSFLLLTILEPVSFQGESTGDEKRPHISLPLRRLRRKQVMVFYLPFYQHSETKRNVLPDTINLLRGRWWSQLSWIVPILKVKGKGKSQREGKREKKGERLTAGKKAF